MKPKTKRQIILETASYYGADPTRHGVLDGIGPCAFVTSTGAMCAIGRLMTDAGLKVYYLDYHTFVDEIEPKYIRPEYREALADPKFARALQRFHDIGLFWNDEGLTEEGKQALSDMLDRWA